MVDVSADLCARADALTARILTLSLRLTELRRRDSNEEGALRAEVRDWLGALQNLEAEAAASLTSPSPSHSHSSDGSESSNDAQALYRAISKARGAFETSDLHFVTSPDKTTRRTGGRILKALLGDLDVRLKTTKERLELKYEYYRFRDRAATVFLIMPLCVLVLFHFTKHKLTPLVCLLVQTYQVWLLYFYTASSLRESVLAANGSDITPWWIWHHTLAVATSLISLSMPTSGSQLYFEFVIGGCQWAVLQGFVMFVQNTYQRKRLYTRIALGNAGFMSVAGAEMAMSSDRRNSVARTPPLPRPPSVGVVPSVKDARAALTKWATNGMSSLTPRSSRMSGRSSSKEPQDPSLLTILIPLILLMDAFQFLLGLRIALLAIPAPLRARAPPVDSLAVALSKLYAGKPMVSSLGGKAERLEWEALACSLMFCFMAMGNVRATLAALGRKSKRTTTTTSSTRKDE